MLPDRLGPAMALPVPGSLSNSRRRDLSVFDNTFNFLTMTQILLTLTVSIGYVSSQDTLILNKWLPVERVFSLIQSYNALHY